jgi:transposase-like protein
MRNSMTQQRRFTKEFEEEAARLVETGGRTQREIAGDLGIGLLNCTPALTGHRL